MQAWQSFGVTLQMITSLGLHRRIGGNRGLGLNVTHIANHAKMQSERRLFWSAYVLDRQISTLFGRPNRWNDDMIDQGLPDCVEVDIDDEDADEDGPVQVLRDCYTTGLIHQAS